MERDSHKEELPLPTPEEEAVIRQILFRCMHANTERIVVRRLHYSLCRDCGKDMMLGYEEEARAISDAEIVRRWKTGLPRPASHLVVAEAALAEVGRAGWEVRMRQTADQFVCTAFRGDRIARSKVHGTRASAIVDALAQIADEFRGHH